MSKEEPKVISFDKCPCCGSTNRYCESLGNQEKARGHMRKDMHFCFQVIDGMCLDQGMDAKLPMGTTLPAYHVTTDICSDCGTLYVTQIVEDEVTKQPNLIVPGQQGRYKMPPFPGTSNPMGN